MGCDIHVYLEKKKKINDVEQWVNIDHWQKNPYFNMEGYEDERELEHVSAYQGRNYELFGILAGVRDNSMNPIDDPRGLPDDISNETRKEYELWGRDAHTPTYFTLDELLDFYQKKPKHRETLDYFLVGIKERFDNEFIFTRNNKRNKECEEKFRVIFWFDN
jgi:hypothetical protein